MADEKPDKRMEFILEQQAQFAAQIGQLEDIVARLAKATLDRFESTDRRMDETDRRINALVDSQIRAEDRMDEADKRLAALIDSHIRAGDRMAETDKRLAALIESQAQTGEAVRNLAAAVDRYFSEGRNGKSDSES